MGCSSCSPPTAAACRPGRSRSPASRLAAGSQSARCRSSQFAVAVAVILGLQIMFYRTALGRAFRATSDDQTVAQLVGLDNRHVFALAMAVSLAIIAVAGVFL